MLILHSTTSLKKDDYDSVWITSKVLHFPLRRSNAFTTVLLSDKPFSENHPLKRRYRFLRTLYETKSFRKKYKLVKENKDLYIEKNESFQVFFSELISANFPDISEKRRKKLHELKSDLKK